MIEKHAASHTTSLTDLSAELKSLKTLLLARRPISPSPHYNSSSPGLGVNGNGGNGGSEISSAANALLGPRNGSGSGGGSGKAAIPSWQLEGMGGGGESGASSATEGSG